MSRKLYLLGSHIYRVTLSISPTKRSLRCISTDNAQKTTVTSGRWRRFWRSWVPIPTSVGLTVLAVLQWRRLQRGKSPEQGVTVAKDWEITCYRAIPCRAFSRAWGWVSNCQLPGPLRSFVYGLYSSMYGVNLDEMAGHLTDYPSLCQFFTRELKQGVRPIDPSNCIVSPADGKILNCGKIHSCHVEQIKGVTYSIQTFLGEPSWHAVQTSRGEIEDSNETFLKRVIDSKTDENDNELIAKSKSAEENQIVPSPFWKGLDVFNYLIKTGGEQICRLQDNWDEYKTNLLMNPKNELYQLIVYLAPGDYHRFHSPVHWQVNFRRHFQGELLSVNPLIAGWLPELFSLNERVVYAGQWEHGFFSMTCVGATNVGSIRVYSDKTLHTNTRKWRDGTRHKDHLMDVTWNKGEEVGEFRMGSTIVLIFEAPKDYVFETQPNQRILVGQSLCCKTQIEERSRKG